MRALLLENVLGFARADPVTHKMPVQAFLNMLEQVRREDNPDHPYYEAVHIFEVSPRGLGEPELAKDPCFLAQQIAAGSSSTSSSTSSSGRSASSSSSSSCGGGSSGGSGSGSSNSDRGG